MGRAHARTPSPRHEEMERHFMVDFMVGISEEAGEETRRAREADERWAQSGREVAVERALSTNCVGGAVVFSSGVL